MNRWRRSLAGLALILAGLLAACTRPAPVGSPFPLIVLSDTPGPGTAMTATVSPAAASSATPLAPTTTAPATASPGPASPTAWPTVQTATPLFVPDLPTLGAETATSPPEAATLPPTPPPAATLPATATPATPAGAPAPAIASFTIDPAEIQPGQPVTLTWQASGDQITLQRLDMLGRLGQFFDVGPSGSMQLSPPPEQRGEVQFMLFASGGGATVQADVRATILCPDTWFFANPPSLCPAGPATSTAMQAQSFEHGLMVWTQAGDRIYTLYGDGGFPRWDVGANAWFPGQPESDPSLVPPPGLYQPVRGFGVAWRTGYVSPIQVARDRLGWATGPEFAVPNAQVQCDSAPRYSRCYLTSPSGGVYVLEPERSGWGER